MLGIDRYLFRQVAIASLFIVVTLTGALWLTQSMRFIQLILNQGLSLVDFLHLTGLLLPTFMLVVLPMSLFFAVLFTFNKMLNDREMVILRNAGVGPLGIARPVLYLATMIVGVLYFIGLYLMPVALQEFRTLKTEIRNSASAALLTPGVFRNLGSDLTVYVRERDGDQLRGILLQDDRETGKRITLTAERGALVPGELGPKVVLSNGTRQEQDLRTGELSMLYFDRYSLELASLALDEPRGWQEPNERFLHQLFNPDDTANDQEYRSQLIAAGHHRLASPLITFSVILIAVACMLHGQFNKRGQNKRLGLAVALGGAVYGGALGFYSLAQTDNAWIPMIYVNAILPGLAALAVLVRGSRRAAHVVIPANPAPAE